LAENEEVMKRKHLSFSEEQLNRIDDYRKNIKGIPNQTDAIRELVDLGYEAWKKEKESRGE